MRLDNSLVRPSSAPRAATASGMCATLSASGGLERFEAGGLSLVLYPATALERGLAGPHLRRHGAAGIEETPLLGPSASSASADGSTLTVRGRWGSLAYVVHLDLADDELRWGWRVEVANEGPGEQTVDVVLLHDPALAPFGAVRTNEYYVAQYLDLTPLGTGEHGTAVAVRQNMPGPAAPWMVLGSHGRCVAWSTDALQLVDRTGPSVDWAGLRAPSLPSARLQHEHPVIALEDEPRLLAPGGSTVFSFYGAMQADHPAATGPSDAEVAAQLAARPLQPGATTPDEESVAPWSVAPTLFAVASAFPSRSPSEKDLRSWAGAPEDERQERAEDGTLLALTRPAEQVVTLEKDARVLRPHGHIVRTGDSLSPTLTALTSTMWMAGTFHSQVTRGHVGKAPLLTPRRTYLGLLRAHGLRLFVRGGGDEGWRLLEAPSAWRVTPDSCTWWYADDSGTVLQVDSLASVTHDELGLEVRVLDGGPVELLAALQVADQGSPAPAVRPHAREEGAGLVLDQTGENGSTWTLRWDGDVVVGDDAPLVADGVSRSDHWITLQVPATREWALRIAASGSEAGSEAGSASGSASGSEAGSVAGGDGHADGDRAGLGGDFWDLVANGIRLSLPAPAAEGPDVADLAAALPWFAHDAVVHFLSPRGLEQFTGGGWGTRDVCQGPVGLLTALGRHGELREVLLRVFRAQNERGDWPQAFEFLPPLPEAGQWDSHGDVVYWPVAAAGEYLLTTEDASLLDERLPFVGDDGLTAPATVAEHLARAVDRIAQLTVADSPLPAYGHGDWNDSLQPADPQLSAHMVSTWTAVLQTHSLDALGRGLQAVHREPDLSDRAGMLAADTEVALQEILVAYDNVLPGYVVIDDDGGREPLVHPRDERTGLTYGVLPWIHAVSGELLTPEQASQHMDLVREHLLGPDGVRLFDRPVAYSGGPMTVFQRAEASTFWGREIGLMYVHAHLRYAEALAHMGDGEALLEALVKVSPDGLVSLVPSARPRQSTCYYSSSDGAFVDRYDAQEHYPDLMAGHVLLEGGWRVYSSGPGLTLRLVVEALLGLRVRGKLLEVDPVLARSLDGLEAEVTLGDGRVRVRYTVGPQGCGIGSVAVEDADGSVVAELALDALRARYRDGGASVALADLHAALASAGPASVLHVVTR